MNEHCPQGMTQLLQRWSNGEQPAFNQLISAVYDELSRVARRQMRRERPGRTLQTTGLVHEAYMRLLELRQIDWRDRTHFFVVAAGVMRRVLVDQARAHRALKRGGDASKVTLDDAHLSVPADQAGVDLVALDTALEQLLARDRLQAQVVELRYFAGLTVDETARTLGTSPATVKRKWAMARAWLYRQLHPQAL